MGHEERTGAASLHGLARVERERHWTTILDTVLAFILLLWVAGVAVPGLMPSLVVNALPVMIGVLVVHRLLVVLERMFRQPGPDRSLDDGLPDAGITRAA